MTMSPDESFVEKRLKKDRFKVVKVDIEKNYKSPDFLISKNEKPIALVEVKRGFKVGERLERLETGAFRFDPWSAVDEYFSEASLQFKEFITHNTEYAGLPLLLIFISPFFINEELEYEVSHYKKYTDISAVFKIIRTHPLDQKAEKMSIEELESIIYSKKIPFESQTKLGWIAILNNKSKHHLPVTEFPSIKKIIRIN